MVLLIIWISIDKSEQIRIYRSFIVCKCRIGRFIIIHCNRTNNQTKTPCYSMKYRNVWQHIGNSRPSVTCRNKIKGLELHQMQATGGKYFLIPKKSLIPMFPKKKNLNHIFISHVRICTENFNLRWVEMQQLWGWCLT